ncbi:hypothetical protein [Kitasatospora sp. NPDC091207]|uniref:hypothetical protein n=1 Tax=Kitasatospora sp. NPDC091207 TaxID=3364083 RepID=UPI0038230505
MTTRPAHLLCLILLVGPLSAACGAEPDGSFDARPGTPTPSCLQHQVNDPGADYTGGEKSDPRAVLEMMRFYTANGTKAYCDGRPPTDTDRRWTGLYVALGGDAGHLPPPER